MQKTDYRHLERLRVRWAEVDMQRIVFNGHYLMYADTAVAGYWRSLAMPYHETMHALAGDLYVRKATVEYLASARYDDVLDIGVRCERIGTSSILFRVGIFDGTRLLVSVELVYVFADPDTQRSQPVPPALRETLLAFEAGEPMVTVVTARWADGPGCAEPARRLRDQVFVQEQGIPAELEHGEDDARALHALARNRFGRTIATGRLLDLGQGIGKIGRMAVLRDLRGSGVGRRVLQALQDDARTRGLRVIVLHAQHSAIGFYERAGYRREGPGFEEAGIPHQAMALDL